MNFFYKPRYKITVTRVSLVFMQLSVMGAASEVKVPRCCTAWVTVKIY